MSYYTYLAPAGRSPAELFRNYKQEFQRLGIDVQYEKDAGQPGDFGSTFDKIDTDCDLAQILTYDGAEERLMVGQSRDAKPSYYMVFVTVGAYGISSYLEGTGNNLRLPLNPPFSSPESETDYFTSNLPATTTGQGLLPPTDPFHNAIIRLWDANIRPAISQQWNLSVEHQFGHSTTLQVGYVGQHGTRCRR